MEFRMDHPEIRTQFELASPARLRWWAWLGLGLWLLLAGGDWAARFGIFHWQNDWIVRRHSTASPSSRPGSGSQSRTIPAQTGAGLTKMVPVPWIAARYSEFHPEYVEQWDAEGYKNAPLPAGRTYDVVMVGDSFMLSLGTQHVAQVLADISGHGVFNHAMYGAGPFLEMPRFIGSGRFKPPPKVVIWNLTARELGAPLFLRQPVAAWFEGVDVWAKYKETIARPGIRRDLLVPAVLSKAWPNTSIIAYFCRNAWAQIKLVALRSWPRDVLGADDPQFGPMLFYRENLRMLPRLTPGENAQSIVQVVLKIAQRFRERGATLVVLLVPEKEQIHIRALSAADQSALARGPELLAEIESGLEAGGTPAVNLMPVFQEATARGQRLYWRDDTHWNDAGIRLAAEELWRVVAPLLK
jgi:hypothetical protein